MREKLINIISRCSNKEYRYKWMIEMSNNGIECPESACDSCVLRDECLDLFSQDYIYETKNVNETKEVKGMDILKANSLDEVVCVNVEINGVSVVDVKGLTNSLSTVECPQCKEHLYYIEGADKVMCNHCNIIVSLKDICQDCGAHTFSYNREDNGAVYCSHSFKVIRDNDKSRDDYVMEYQHDYIDCDRAKLINEEYMYF